jgi:hypothetical protein
MTRFPTLERFITYKRVLTPLLAECGGLPVAWQEPHIVTEGK